MGNSPTVPIQSSEIVGTVNNINSLYNPTVGRDANSNGVFATFPMSSPKYARHRQFRHHEYMDTMARMFIDVPPDIYTSFINSLEDGQTQDIARVLCGDGVNKGGRGYFDFLLQNANHSLNEKVQIVETLEDSYVAFFFGTSPPMWRYSGTLMNTYQDDWTMRMFRIYDQLARGTQLARRAFSLRLRYDSMIVSGAMTDLNWSLQGGLETYCPFSFTLLVKSVTILYGGLGRPTKLPKDAHFLPEGFVYSEPDPPVQTDIECSAAPEGVQQTLVDTREDWELSQEEWDAKLGANPDATGTVIESPELQLTASSAISPENLELLREEYENAAGENLAQALRIGNITEDSLSRYMSSNNTQLEKLIPRDRLAGALRARGLF